MKNKKRTLTLLCVLVLMVALFTPFAVYAHSGGTDANGGHYSSGGYHYHHGYSAHSHYDMDGDGDIDCPYDFTDATDNNSGGSGGSSGSSGYSGSSSRMYSDGYAAGYNSGVVAGRFEGAQAGYDDGYSKGHTEGYAEGQADGYQAGYSEAETKLTQEYEALMDEKVSQATWTTAVISGLLCALIGWLLAARHFAEGNRRNREKHKAELEALQREKEQLSKSREAFWADNQSLREEIREMKNRAALGQAANLVDVADLPDGIDLISVCLPTKGKIYGNRIYGDYTVYTSANGKKYHARYRCGNATTPIHLFQVPDCLEPCKNCVPTDKYQRAWPDWYARIVSAQTEEVIHKASTSQEGSTVETPPKSSVISKVEYKDGVLQLAFTGGGVYQYFNVPESVYTEMLCAQSWGRFFHEHINGKYPYGVIR